MQMKQSEKSFLEQSRIALTNVASQNKIATMMAEFGYDEESLNQGKKLLKEALDAYNLNKQEDQETTEAYALFSQKKEALQNLYRLHRKKAKVIFKKDPMAMTRLGLAEALPRTYLPWMEIIRKFYQESQDLELQKQMRRLKVTPEEITKGNTLITETEAARAEYLREKGESQDATKQKDLALTQLDEWIREFFDVAKIALEDNPQLLESLGKLVRS